MNDICSPKKKAKLTDSQPGTSQSFSGASSSCGNPNKGNERDSTLTNREEQTKIALAKDKQSNPKSVYLNEIGSVEGSHYIELSLSKWSQDGADVPLKHYGIVLIYMQR